MTDAGFDFRAPPAGALERQVGGWLAAACRRAAGAWAKALPFPAGPELVRADPATAAVGLAAAPPDAVGFRLAAGDGPGDAALLALPRPALLALLGGLLGEASAAPPADRELTAIEAGLCPYLLRELFLAPLEAAWPVPEQPLALTAGPGGPPRTVWRVPGEDMAVLAELTIALPSGGHPAVVLVPRTGRFAAVGRRPAAAPPPADRAHIEALVREMSVDLAVVLGEAELSMADLARLRAGDLVVLRQRVTDPLDARVGGARKFRVWPGAVGSRAAVQVHAPADG